LVLTTIKIAADPVQRETLAGETVESGLVPHASQIVAGDPWSGCALLKDAANRDPAEVAVINLLQLAICMRTLLPPPSVS
jgi:hypothetical protein